MMLISNSLDKIFRLLKFSGKTVTSLSGNFSIENCLFKNIFAHKFFIFQPIFKTFAANKTTNFAPNIVVKIFCFPPN